MKYLVTGGAGFIGSNLVERLTREGDEVLVVDNFFGGVRNKAELERNPKVQIVERDIRTKIDDLLDGVDCIFHLAAIPNVQFSIENPELTSQVNFLGSINVLESAKKAGVKRVIFSSSASVYGEPERLPISENFELNPLSPYASQKASSEKMMKVYAQSYGVDTINLRYFNVFGPKLNPDGAYALVIGKFLKLVSEGKPPIIYGDGEQTRDFVYVDDVVNANILASRMNRREAFGKSYNIGSGKSLSVNEICQSILEGYGSSLKPVYVNPVKEPRNSRADISEAERVLDWKPQIGFREGLRRTIEEFRSR